MPGYRKRNQGPCQQRQRRGMRLILRPSLLLLLVEKESHGYELYDQLEVIGFDLEWLDSSIVYRDLREMEEMGLIESSWDDDSKGPKRRVYRILAEGQERLKDWIDNLESIQDRIQKLRERYDKSL